MLRTNFRIFETFKLFADCIYLVLFFFLSSIQVLFCKSSIGWRVSGAGEAEDSGAEASQEAGPVEGQASQMWQGGH